MTSGENKMKVSDTSTSTEYTIVKIRESPELDENDNPESVEKDTHEVESGVNEGETNPNSLILQVGIWQYMEMAQKPDRIYYEKDIIRTINPPKVAGNRGRFTFDTIVFDTVVNHSLNSHVSPNYSDAYVCHICPSRYNIAF